MLLPLRNKEAAALSISLAALCLARPVGGIQIASSAKTPDKPNGGESFFSGAKNTTAAAGQTNWRLQLFR